MGPRTMGRSTRRLIRRRSGERWWRPPGYSRIGPDDRVLQELRAIADRRVAERERV